MGHNATKGCNKCYKHFNVQVGEQCDFSGFDRENWTLRNEEQQGRDVHRILQEATKKGIEERESELGVRYSLLLGLSFFDPIEFTAIDVMHNLFLRSAKRVLEYG